MIPPMSLASLTGQIQGNVAMISHLKTPPIDVENAEEIKEILVRHGCTIQQYPDHDDITFPPNTRRWRGLTTGISERYTLQLPDSYLIYEIYDTVRALSFLFFPREAQT